MKKMLKILLGIIITIYLAVMVFTTTFLLKKNDFGAAKFFNNYLVLVEDKVVNSSYNKNDLLIINEKNRDSIKVGESIFYFDVMSTKKTIKLNEVKETNKIGEQQRTFKLMDNSVVVAENVMGTVGNTKVLSFFGTILSIFQSRYGFLFLVIFPLSLLFIYEIYAIYKEFKENK